MTLYTLVLAGGPGSRLWPLSRMSQPKQVMQLPDGKSMLQSTIERIKTFCPSSPIYVATGKPQEPLVRETLKQWSDVNLLIEPHRRNTGPSIALAIAKLSAIDPKGALVVVPSDHFFSDPQMLFGLFDQASELVSHTGGLALFGAKPTYPASKYGYIAKGKPVPILQDFPAFQVAKFVEKPSEEKAKGLVSGGDYFWNMGIFLGKLETFEELFQKYAPEIWAHAATIKQAVGTKHEDSTIDSAYLKMPSISVDFAVVEKCDNLVVIPCDVEWTDLGDWAAIYNMLPKTPDGNVMVGDVHVLDTFNSYLHGSEKPIVAIGLSNIVIIDTQDALLVVPMDKAQSVSKILDYLQQNGRKSLL